jgi:hypothetical protein
MIASIALNGILAVLNYRMFLEERHLADGKKWTVCLMLVLMRSFWRLWPCFSLPCTAVPAAPQSYYAYAAGARRQTIRMTMRETARGKRLRFRREHPV